MGRVWLSRGELINTLYETAGYKTGLCLEFDDIIKFTNYTDYCKILMANLKSVVTIRAEEFDDIYLAILKGTGHIPKEAPPFNLPPGVTLYHKYKNSEHFNDFIKVQGLFLEGYKAAVDKAIKSNSKFIDPVPTLKKCRDELGEDGFNICMEFFDYIIYSEQMSPFNRIRRIDWKDTISIKNLFKSESLETFHGSYIDQRYIDYLSENFNRIGEINWRKFEALTCEYFERAGYYVEIGSGRNDGGIDARIWMDKQDSENPPLLLVQCKRYKEKINRVIVKALWADVNFENAKSGLIVTSSEISKGAKEDCLVRGYNILFSERTTLKKWIEEMRTPYKSFYV